MKAKLEYDIMIMATARWDGPYSSTAYSLAKALSKHTRVFYLDNPKSIKHFITHRHSDEIQKRTKALLKGENVFCIPDSAHPQLVVVTPKLVLPSNWLPDGLLYDSLSKYNDQIISEVINKTIKEYCISKYLLINISNPILGRFFKLTLNPALKIYQSVDDMSQAPYMRKHGARLEKQAIQKADITITTSSELKKRASAYSEKVFVIPNAANVKLFQSAGIEKLAVPQEIKVLPPNKKIICYVGNICHRLDYNLLLKIARHHHNKTLLMIGPFGNTSFKDSGLDLLPNVVFTGGKKIEELPAYLQHSACCIIPFLCNQFTKSIYPLKINEYLSAGKPVISTNFSEDILSFNDIVYVSDSHEKFIDNIDKAIAEDGEDLKNKRIEISRPNDWENRAVQLFELINDFIHTKVHDTKNIATLSVSL